MGWDSYIFTLEDSKHKECSWDCFAFKALCWGTVCEKVVQFFLHLVKCDLYRGQNSLIQQVFVRHCGSHSSATQNRQGFCPPEAPSCGRCLQDRGPGCATLLGKTRAGLQRCPWEVRALDRKQSTIKSHLPQSQWHTQSKPIPSWLKMLTSLWSMMLQ